MTLRGHIQGGIIVLDGDTQLPEGAAVEVRVLPAPPPKDKQASPLLKYIGIVKDLPPDASASVDRVLYGTPPE
jgi:hypothetical protein